MKPSGPGARSVRPPGRPARARYAAAVDKAATGQGKGAAGSGDADAGDKRGRERSLAVLRFGRR